MKFEILPPGQEATRIIPKAIIGDMRSPRAIARRKVKAGRSRNWHNAPIRTPLGFLKTSIKTDGWISRAMPNITKESTVLMTFMPPTLRLTSMLSIAELISGLIYSFSAVLPGLITISILLDSFTKLDASA